MREIDRMKKLLAAALALLMLAGCASSNPKPSESTTPPAPESSAPAEPSSSGGIEVDEGMFTVEMTVPASFFDEGTTQEDLDEACSEKGWKAATLNEDGSVTYVMSKAQHNQLMSELAAQIDDSMKEMENSEDYPSIVKVDANKNYTEFKVYLNTDEVGLMESFTVLAFYMYGGMYNAFDGTDIDDIAVCFINNETGETIEEAHSKDAG
mgnify:CR=1 FL=1